MLHASPSAERFRATRADSASSRRLALFRVGILRDLAKLIADMVDGIGIAVRKRLIPAVERLLALPRAALRGFVQASQPLHFGALRIGYCGFCGRLRLRCRSRRPARPFGETCPDLFVERFAVFEQML